MAKLRKPRDSTKGLTLVEILIAIAIATTVMVVTAVILKQPDAMVRDLTQTLDVRNTEGAEGQILADRFSRAFVLRRNFLTCSPDDIENLLETRAAIPGGGITGNFTLTGDFTIAYSTFSSLGAYAGANQIRMTDVSRLGKGDLLLLTALNHPTLGGTFLVDSVNYNTSVATLTLPITIPPAFRGCTLVGANNKGLEPFRSDPRNVIYGEQGNTYRVDVIQIARYFVQDLPPWGRTLMVQTWPSSLIRLEGEGETVPAVPGYQEIQFLDTRWDPQGLDLTQNPVIPAANGIFRTTMRLRRSERQSARNNASVDRAIDRQVSSVLATGGQVNFGAVTIPPPTSLTFPTCGITLSSELGNIHRDDDQFVYMKRLGAVLADVSGFASIDVAINASITCWQGSEANPNPAKGGRLEVPTPQPNTTNATITLQPSGQPTTYVCDTPPGTTFVGTYSYFDARYQAVVQVPCGEVSTAAAVPYEFEYPVGQQSTCTNAGNISLGTLRMKVTLEPGPPLYVMSCTWENPVDTECTPDPAKGTLNSVTLGPKNIPGTLTGHSGADNNIITCAP